ncbi:hypothetical protein GOV03_01095 [Candidatus Woesearchaeota archaeon]|nr:hypothetical protein [Candidatus Woesearchaeota archaeon]
MKLGKTLVSIAVAGALALSSCAWKERRYLVKEVEPVVAVKCYDSGNLTAKVSFESGTSIEWTRVITNFLGENLFVHNYENDKDTVNLEDNNADGNIDRICNYGLDQCKSRGDEGTEELFQQADQLFSEYKQKIGNYVNLGEESKKCREKHDLEQRFINRGLLDNL